MSLRDRLPHPHHASKDLPTRPHEGAGLAFPHQSLAPETWQMEGVVGTAFFPRVKGCGSNRPWLAAVGCRGEQAVGIRPLHPCPWQSLLEGVGRHVSLHPSFQPCSLSQPGVVTKSHFFPSTFLFKNCGVRRRIPDGVLTYFTHHPRITSYHLRPGIIERDP